MKILRTVILIIIVAAVINVNHVNGKEWKRDDDDDDDDHGDCGDNLTWEFSNGILTIEGTGEMWNFSYDFSCPWYNKLYSLETIVVKEGVTSIGNYAFDYLPLLSSVSLPNSLTSIGENAFSYCDGVHQFIIPAAVTSIGAGAFSWCGGLENITVPENVVSIGDGAFACCDRLSSIFVDEKNTQFKSIDGILFSTGGDTIVQFPKGKSSSFTIPAGVKTIAGGAFGGCTFSSITIPDSVTSLGNSAFWNCRSLTSIILPNSIESIGNDAFSACDSLTDISIPDSITSISDYTFSGCKSLTHISIPDNVTSIGYSAFSQCKALKTVIIPETVRWIDGRAFLFCEGITHITLPQGIPSIEEYTFYGCNSLKNISIPDTVTSIGESAFEKCTSLTNVFIPGNVTIIDYHAFTGCKCLEDIKIPESVTSIAKYAFSWSGLINVTIPENVMSIGEEAFYRCENLHTVFYQGSHCTQSSLFQYCGNLTNVCVSPDYNCTEFGGVNVTSSNQICHEFRAMFNQCFKASYVDGVFVQDKKKLSAIEWEKQSNSCMEYQCINESGPAAWSVCNSTADVNQFCVDNQCVKNKESVENKKAYVEIEIEDGVKVVGVKTDLILEMISVHYGVDANELVIGYENDEQGNLLRILIYVNEEETAYVIAEGLKDLKQGGCENDEVLCRTKTVRVTVMETEQQFLSGVPKLHFSLTELIILFFVLIIETLSTSMQ